MPFRVEFCIIICKKTTQKITKLLQGYGMIRGKISPVLKQYNSKIF